MQLCSTSYSFIDKIFYKSLVDAAPPDSMAKLRKQTSVIGCKTNLLQEKNKHVICWLFSRICVLTRQNKASRWNMLTLFSIFFGFLSTREATYAMSFIATSFPT